MLHDQEASNRGKKKKANLAQCKYVFWCYQSLLPSTPSLPLKCHTAYLLPNAPSYHLSFRSFRFTIGMVWNIWSEGCRSSFVVRRYYLNVQNVFDHSQWFWPVDIITSAVSARALKAETGVGGRGEGWDGGIREHTSCAFFHCFLLCLCPLLFLFFSF